MAKQSSKVSGDIWATTSSQRVSRMRSELGKIGKLEGKFDPDHKIEIYYKPEVVGLKTHPIWITTEHIAVVMRLLKSGSSKSTVNGPPNQEGKPPRIYDTVWQTGSIHYLGGDVTLDRHPSLRQ